MFNITWFAVAVLYVNWRGHEVSPDLVQWWFIAWVSEFATLGGITVCKTVKKKKEEVTGEDEQD